MDNHTTRALSRIGRTEDIHISPDGHYLALAAYLLNKILIIRININKEKNRWNIALNKSFEITSNALSQPHGVFWLDNQHIMVANRSADSIILKIPKHHSKSNLDLVPVSSIKARILDLDKDSSCLHVYNFGAGLYEALFCSNDGHYVSAHILDESKKFAIQSSIILLQKDLNVPDGVAVSNDKKWIGVSNHDKHNIFIYPNHNQLDKHTDPSAILSGPMYPHGIIFFNDDHYIFVADAGAPFVYGFFSPSGIWKGQFQPFIKLQVMDEDSFAVSHVNVQEGGPKGIYITQDTHLLIITCDQLRLAFFDLKKILKPFKHKIKKKDLDRNNLSSLIEITPLLRHLNYMRLNANQFNEDIKKIILKENINKSLTLKIVLKFIFNKCLLKIKNLFLKQPKD
jgi:hypothetical protein